MIREGDVVKFNIGNKEDRMFGEGVVYQILVVKTKQFPAPVKFFYTTITKYNEEGRIDVHKKVGERILLTEKEIVNEKNSRGGRRPQAS